MIDLHGPRPLVRLFLAVQGIGAIVLAHFVIRSIGDAGGDLTFPELWGSLLFTGGIMALIQASIGHTKASWSVSGAAISVAMIGRALDIFANIDEFVGRPGLAVAIWAVMGVGTLTAWMVIGALAGTRR